MEDFSDIEKANNIAIFITDRLRKGIRTLGRIGKSMVVRTKCLKCLETMSCKASVALVVSRVTIGFRVII